MTLRERKEKRLQLYLEAEERVLLNQSYTIGNRTYTRANLSEIRKVIDTLSAELDENLSKGRVKFAVFKDR